MQKELKLRDFENLDRISSIEFESMELQHLKKLYMITPKVFKRYSFLTYFTRPVTFRSFFKLYEGFERSLEY
jgi:hypothetical protein